MMNVTVAALFGVLVFGAVGSAQEPAQEQRERKEIAEPARLGPVEADEFHRDVLRRLELQREAELERLNQCTLRDGTSRRVNTTVVFNGWTYRCVEVLGSHFERVGAGWTRVPDPEQERAGR